LGNYKLVKVMELITLLLRTFVLISCSYKVFVARGSYCLFLICLSIRRRLTIFVSTKSFWYCCILLLIYIGGVYVLLLFVSIYSYNRHSYSKVTTATLISLSFIIFYYIGMPNNVDRVITDINLYRSINDERLNILSSYKWVRYIFILITILVSILVFSFVFNDKSNYIR